MPCLCTFSDTFACGFWRRDDCLVMIGICNGGVSVLRATTSVRTCASTPQRHRGQPARLATTSRSTCALCVQTTTSSRRRVGAGRCGQPRSGGSSRLRRRSAGEGTGQVRRGRRQRHRHRRFAGRHQLRPRRRPRDLRRPSTGFANNDLVRADEPLCLFAESTSTTNDLAVRVTYSLRHRRRERPCAWRRRPDLRAHCA